MPRCSGRGLIARGGWEIFDITYVLFETFALLSPSTLSSRCLPRSAEEQQERQAGQEGGDCLLQLPFVLVAMQYLLDRPGRHHT